jgi:hypothetical protein
MCFLPVASCRRKITDFSNLKSNAEKKAVMHAALTRAMTAAITDNEWHQDGIWCLQQLARVWPDAALEQFLHQMIPKFKGHPFERMINPQAPKFSLKKYHDLNKFLLSVASVYGEPESEAVSNINKLLAVDESSGYLLSHQVAVIEWAKNERLRLPDGVEERKKDLISKLEREQLSDVVFSDLFAERAFILSLYGQPDSKEMERWVEIILKAQQPDGLWRDNSTSTFFFYGDKVEGFYMSSHTTALAMGALGFYYAKL